MLDIISFALGKKSGKEEGKGVVEIDGENVTFTDDGNGNITIEEES